MTRTVALADLPALVGQELGVSGWLLIDQERVDRFADATNDHQWIHVDVDRATREIGGPIAHGYLTLTLVSTFGNEIMRVEDAARTLNYGLNKVRFTAMVRVGQRVRMRQTLLAAEPRAGGLQLTSACTIEVEGEERPACVAESLAVLYAA